MKYSMEGHEKGDLWKQVTAWSGLSELYIFKFNNKIFSCIWKWKNFILNHHVYYLKANNVMQNRQSSVYNTKSGRQLSLSIILTETVYKAIIFILVLCELDYVCGLWSLTPLSKYFSYIVVFSFIGGGNRCTRRKPSTCRKSMTNFIV